MRVAVIGVGYVGLVTGACAASWQHEVVGIDTEPERVTALSRGRVPFFEPGLGDLVADGLAAGTLRFSGPDPEVIASADLVFIAVGTHDGRNGWQIAALEAALAQTVPHLSDDAALVVRSTLPPGTIGGVPELVDRLDTRPRRVALILNPEFTREGNAVRDFLAPDRIVIGVMRDPVGRGEQLVREFYAGATAPILVMSARDAGMAKLASNLFLATKISFANELARICDAYGATIDQVVAVMGMDRRIGAAFLQAGVGFGGSCLPNQVTMMNMEGRRTDADWPLLRAVEHVNAGQRGWFVQRVEEAVGGRRGARVALLGLTFKPHTDDLRDAPSLDIAQQLLDRGLSVVAYDPMTAACARAEKMVPGLVTVDSAMAALENADVAGLVTEWPEFRVLDWHSAGRAMRSRLIVDGRNALNPGELVAANFSYVAPGRGRHEPMPASGRRLRPVAPGPSGTASTRRGRSGGTVTAGAALPAD